MRAVQTVCKILKRSHKGQQKDQRVTMLSNRYRTEMLVALVFVAIQVLGGGLELLTPARASAESAVPVPGQTRPSHALVIGFVGGFVHADDLRHSEVQIARQIQATYGNGVQVQLFENRRTEQAHKLVLDWLNVGDGKLTDDEKHDARLILFGH